MKILINGKAFNINGSVFTPFWNDLNSGNWERHTFEIIDYFVREGNNTIDIGCWAGPISFYLAAKGAQVYSIDPDPSAYDLFMENLNLNPTLKPRIHPFNMAITPQNQEVMLYARKHYGFSSTSTLKRIRDTLGNITVKGICFDELLRITCLTRIDFIKLDIEGAEFEVLPGIMLVMEKIGLPTLFVSFHYSHLNEFIYRDMVRFRYLSLLMMKFEQFMGMYIFKSKLIAAIRKSLQFAGKYSFIYTESGEQIYHEALSPEWLLQKRLNLVFSDREWIKKVKDIT